MSTQSVEYVARFALATNGKTDAVLARLRRVLADVDAEGVRVERADAVKPDLHSGATCPACGVGRLMAYHTKRLRHGVFARQLLKCENPKCGFLPGVPVLVPARNIRTSG